MSFFSFTFKIKLNLVPVEKHLTLGLSLMRGIQEMPIGLMAHRCPLAPGEADVSPQMNQLMMNPDTQAMNVDT